MLEQIILGIIQGVTEWLPVSSEGMIVLISKKFFSQELATETIIRQALFLHLGTFLAALIYFRKDVWSLTKAFFNYQSADLDTQKIFKFLIIATLISGFLGLVLVKVLTSLEEYLALSSKIIILIIGLSLLITGLLQIRARQSGHKKAGQLTNKDGWLLGFVQGLAALPGFSRSGLTVSAFLLRNFDKFDSLKLSFLMSLPIVLVGNIILNLSSQTFSLELIWGLVFSFIFGLLTINLLLKLARKINFGYFVLLFSILVLISAFI